MNGLCVLVNTHSKELATGQIIKIFDDFPRSYSILSVFVQIPRCSAHISAQSLLTELSDTITYSYCFCSSAIVVTALRAGRSGVRFSTEGISFTLLQTPTPLSTSSGLLTAYLLWVESFSLCVKLSRSENDYFSPYSNEFKTKWNCSSSPQYTHTVCIGQTLHLPLSINVT